MSRLSGLFREIAMAISFGASPEIAAFIVSYRLANLFRRLLGEGNLQAGFVPHFTALKEEGGRFFRDVAYSMAIILLLTVAVLEMILWGLRAVAAPDWRQIVDLAMWMVPGLFFICLYGLNSSLLQCRKKYFIPAAAPVVFNLIWIIAVLIFPNVTFLSIIITLAFAGQWFVTVFEGAKLLSFKEWLKPTLFSPEFKKLLKPLFLGIIGIGAVQFNSALDSIFARFADLKGPTFLWYAIRVQQLPIALFGLALTGALLPSLSRTENPIRRNELLHSSLKQGAALMLISTFGIFALGRAGIQFLFYHGHFTFDDVTQTTHCLWGYGLGLVPSVFVLLLSSKFYAEKNYRTPTIASLISVGANLFFNALFVFVFGWGAISIAIATSLSAYLNAALLSKDALNPAFWLFFFKLGFACAIAALLVFGLQGIWESGKDLFLQSAQLAFCGLFFLAVVGGLSWLFKIKEIFGLIKEQKEGL